MRKQVMRIAAALAALALLAAACDGGSGDPAASEAGAADAANPAKGGTLRVALVSDVQEAFDPQKEYYGVAWEYDRCCLLRTLLSYNGKTTEEQGGQLFPDLAADDPEISADGLTWTFTLQQGLRYAPPLEDVEITAGDFVRAMERTADPRANVGGYSFYYSVIDGFDEYADGKADDISGIEAVDDHTLAVRLTEPTGDLGYRMAMPAAAPIPPNPSDERAPFGVAEGHDANYGRFMVATGPYMFEGSEDLDFSVPADEQKPVAGYQPGRSIVLVRNPSWDESTDPLRPAYPDRIETTIGGTSEDLALQVEADEIDLVLALDPKPLERTTMYAKCEDPTTGWQLCTAPSWGKDYADGLHVRAALVLAQRDRPGVVLQ